MSAAVSHPVYILALLEKTKTKTEACKVRLSASPSSPWGMRPLPLLQPHPVPARELSAKQCWTSLKQPSCAGQFKLPYAEVCVAVAFDHILLFKALVVVSQLSHRHFGVSWDSRGISCFPSYSLEKPHVQVGVWEILVE